MRGILAVFGTPVAILILLYFVLPAPGPSPAGFRAVASECVQHVSEYDPGKTVEGFEATATDGCNTVQWTGSIAQGPAEGTVKFKVTQNVDPWAGDLPNEPGVAGYCKMRAAHEANLWFLNYIKAPVGTEVTVKYQCD